MAINIRSSFSKYLTAADITGDMLVTIEHVEKAKLKDEDNKLAVYFKELEKGLVLNVTNGNIVCDAYGDFDADWVDKQIILYRAKAQYRGKLVNCIRVKLPE